MVYITEQGEMWDQVARKIYGDENMMESLIGQNPELAHVFRFDAGTEIQYKEIAAEKMADLPSWRAVQTDGT